MRTKECCTSFSNKTKLCHYHKKKKKRDEVQLIKYVKQTFFSYHFALDYGPIFDKELQQRLKVRLYGIWHATNGTDCIPKNHFYFLHSSSISLAESSAKKEVPSFSWYKIQILQERN